MDEQTPILIIALNVDPLHSYRVHILPLMHTLH